MINRIGAAPAIGRILVFLMTLLLCWAPIALPIRILLSPNENLIGLITLPILFGLFLVLVRIWGRTIHELPQPLRHYGMRQPKRWIYEWLGGVGIGYGVVLLLFELQGAVGWVNWFTPSRPLPMLLLEGLAVATLVGVAEELVFRGWLLDELKRNLKPNQALALSSIIFALAHGLRFVPASLQWISLACLGWTLGMTKRLTGDRLGLAAGLHTGLVWCYYVLKVGEMIRPDMRVAKWITGFENNPLAGVVGIGLMLSLAIGFTLIWQRQKRRNPAQTL
jgi:uncharacterized protein